MKTNKPTEKKQTTEKVTPSPDLTIPAAILEATGIEEVGIAEVKVFDSSFTVLKGRMTAMELIRTIKELSALASDLTVQLAKSCGRCHDCDECSAEGYDGDDERITLPDYLLDEAGISKDAKLGAIVNEDDNTVTIGEAEYDYDLSDVPGDILDILIASDVCIAELEKHLILEDFVYGI
jgi:bifunctional DNA-binding transcriptional regulator/antitoxin component of YhaV-PrlF toxin-antitoxin module